MLKSAKKTDTNTYTVEITISAEDFKEAVRKAYLKQRTRINVPGFRKGKAPQNMIEKLYGADIFYEDALDALYPAEVEAAYAAEKIEAVDAPYDFDITTMNITEGVEFSFKVTVKPEITLAAYKGLSAEKADVAVTAEEIDGEINRMLERGARIVDVDSRAVENGDITVIDFEGFVDGVAFEGGKAEKYSLTIGSGSFIPGFEEQIIGHSIGDEFDVNVTFPTEYAEELAGKDATFKIKLHEIKVKELPELDDEFAKDQDFDTVDEMKKGIETELAEHKKESADRAFEDAIMQALADSVEGEIPDCMFESKAKENIDNFAQRVKSQGIDLDVYLMYMGMDKESFEAEMKEQAKLQVRLDLAIDKIVELEAFEATQEAIDEEYQKMVDMYKIELDKLKTIVSEETVAAEIKRQAAYKFVVDNAKAKKPAAKKTASKAKKEEGEEKAVAKKKAPAKKKAEGEEAEKKPAAKKPAAKKTAKKDEAAE